jgi:hypothetical protein
MLSARSSSAIDGLAKYEGRANFYPSFRYGPEKIASSKSFRLREYLKER